tara:strand:+ start:20719 stop:21774 length:1056 start_codon:yes stop_codon:yes gene_type:complete
MVKSEFSINSRLIGPNHLPLVIAEIGINHSGSLLVAKKMVDAAYNSGIEVVKHQTHIVNDEMSKEAKNVIPGNANISIYEIMDQCSLNEDDEISLKRYVESKDMIFISTPFSRAAADRLFEMNIPAFKIGSGECNNYPLINHIASFGKPIILSTGMNDIKSIKKAVTIFEKKNIPYALLHTTNIYPTPPHLVRLGAMTQLQKNFPNSVIGLSDHTTTNHACFGAVALGASILERHFTDNMNRKGPDICCSMNPKECKDLLEGVNILFSERGGVKSIIKEEKKTIDFAYSTIVTIRPVNKGEVFTEKNIWVKRPGTGELKAEMYDKVLGTKSKKDIDIDTHLKKSDIEELEI